MEQFLYFEKCAENNTKTNLDNIDPLYLFELGLEYFNIDMFSKSLESYTMTNNDIKYIKKRLLLELSEDKPNYEVVIMFLNKVINSSIVEVFDNTDDFLILLTNVFDVSLRDSVFGNMVLNLSETKFDEHCNQLVDVALHNSYKKSLKLIFKFMEVKINVDSIIKTYNKYKNDDAVYVCEKILKSINKIEEFPSIREYARNGVNKKTQYVFYVGRAVWNLIKFD